MIRTRITDTDDTGGQRIDVPAGLRAGVQRAATLLETELLPADKFDIDAHWQYVRRPDGQLGVALDLTTPYRNRPVGYTGYPFDPDVFTDDQHIRRGLNTPVWNFNQTLGYLTRLDIKHIREGLEQFAPVGGE